MHAPLNARNDARRAARAANRAARGDRPWLAGLQQERLFRSRLDSTLSSED